MKRIVQFLNELGQLKKVKRSGWWIAGIKDPETVAEHSFRVAIIGYLLATLEGADPKKTILMCLFHDIPETRIGDLHKVAQNYIKLSNFDSIVFSDQLKNLPNNINSELNSLFTEFQCNNSKEAQLAHDADRLECLIQAREYQMEGNKNVFEWIESCKNSLKSETAKKIASDSFQSEPHNWWIGLKSD